jgi:hypothetical protein
VDAALKKRILEYKYFAITKLKKGNHVMKKNLFVLSFVFLIVGLFSLPVSAKDKDTLVGFKGGIGVIPVSNVSGPQNANGSFPDVTRNVVLGVNPGGQPWVISKLEAKIKTNGDLKVDGKGLLLAGGNNIGTNANQSVRARLFCGRVAHDSNLVPLQANGDFRIDDVLLPLPPNPCTNPVLLIISSGGSWFAAGIPTLDN